MKVKLSEIVWDFDGKDDDEECDPDLPAEVTVEISLDVEPENPHYDDAVKETAVDAASDKHGFCIKSVGTVQIVPDEEE